MINFIKKLEIKISRELNLEKIQIIDNSDLHRKHKSFNPYKVHLKIIIYSKKFKEMKRIDAHKMIFSLLKEEMKNKIHALEIEIK